MAKPSLLKDAMLKVGGKPTPAPEPPPAAVDAGARATRQAKAATQPSRQGNAAITVYYPVTVRRQLKMLSAETGRTMEDLVAEALNLLFVNYRKPEVAPRKSGTAA